MLFAYPIKLGISTRNVVTKSGGEAEFWDGEFFFFSPGNTEFFCFLRNGIGNFMCLIGIQNFVI